MTLEIFENKPPQRIEVESFLMIIDFKLPEGYIDFMVRTNGADVASSDSFLLLWPITELIELNCGYEVEKFAPEYFLFGSNGSETAYGIERASGHIYELPFIGLESESAKYVCDTFHQLLKKIELSELQ
ncbi:MAG: SMI1/KNR4 family protein [Bacteroidetes bacterium]|nr:SMI1/KNR4 family protein [Bacteroidota bacterium]